MIVQRSFKGFVKNDHSMREKRIVENNRSTIIALKNGSIQMIILRQEDRRDKTNR